MEYLQEVVHGCEWLCIPLSVMRLRLTDDMQCITMGALLNQSMFLILIGIMKGKTMALIGQDFRNVSIPL